jgi:hypothetical protein
MTNAVVINAPHPKNVRAIVSTKKGRSSSLERVRKMA